DGYVVYRSAHVSGADVVHRAAPRGTEDYLVFERAPAAARVSYELDLDAGIAGLRLVGNSLEFMDATGNPEFHISPPTILDISGKSLEPSLSVTVCAVDLSPNPPWGRPTTNPGESTLRSHMAVGRRCGDLPGRS